MIFDEAVEDEELYIHNLSFEEINKLPVGDMDAFLTGDMQRLSRVINKIIPKGDLETLVQLSREVKNQLVKRGLCSGVVPKKPEEKIPFTLISPSDALVSIILIIHIFESFNDNERHFESNMTALAECAHKRALAPLWEAIIKAKKETPEDDLAVAYNSLLTNLQTQGAKMRALNISPIFVDMIKGFFFEEFLARYDKVLRDRLGTFYTPNSVVQFITGGVLSLCKKHFPGRRIKWNDYAAGTGIFPLHVLKLELQEMKELDPPPPVHAIQRRLLTCCEGIEINPVSYTLLLYNVYTMAYRLTGGWDGTFNLTELYSMQFVNYDTLRCVDINPIITDEESEVAFPYMINNLDNILERIGNQSDIPIAKRTVMERNNIMMKYTGTTKYNLPIPKNLEHLKEIIASKDKVKVSNTLMPVQPPSPTNKPSDSKPKPPNPKKLAKKDGNDDKTLDLFTI